MLFLDLSSSKPVWFPMSPWLTFLEYLRFHFIVKRSQKAPLRLLWIPQVLEACLWSEYRTHTQSTDQCPLDHTPIWPGTSDLGRRFLPDRTPYHTFVKNVRFELSHVSYSMLLVIIVCLNNKILYRIPAYFNISEMKPLLILSFFLTKRWSN